MMSHQELDRLAVIRHVCGRSEQSVGGPVPAQPAIVMRRQIRLRIAPPDGLPVCSLRSRVDNTADKGRARNRGGAINGNMTGGRLMFYLLLQTWIWILAAGLLGLVIGWLIWGRRNPAERRAIVDVNRLLRELAACRSRCRELEATGSGTS